MNLFFKSRQKNIPELTMEDAEAILAKVFERCYVDTNSIPVEQLESFSTYKTEKLAVQKIIAVLGLIAFLMLPMFFVAPKFDISEQKTGARGLPVYTVTIKNRLPIYSVTAVLNSYSLPVYEKNKKTFTIEPTSNGTMTVTVSLFSKQWTSEHISVTDVDSDAPVLIGTSQDGDYVYLYIEDEGVGINYTKIQAIDKNGDEIEPICYDEDSGYVEFSTTCGEFEVYIPDYVGNELSVKIH